MRDGRDAPAVRGLASLARSLGAGVRRGGGQAGSARAPRRPVFLADITIASGSELKDRLLEQGLAPDEVLFKYCWPRYAPPLEHGIRSLAKSENLGAQFARLVALHREVPTAFPMPVGTVRSAEEEFVGYLLEYVPGYTVRELLSAGMIEEARRQIDVVEATMARLHAKELAHGDLNTSNIIAADDGRTLLIDPVPYPGSGKVLQDDICIRQLRRSIEDAPLGSARAEAVDGAS